MSTEISYSKPTPPTVPIQCTANSKDDTISNTTLYWILFTTTIVLLLWTLFMLSYVSNIKMAYSGYHPSIVR